MAPRLSNKNNLIVFAAVLVVLEMWACYQATPFSRLDGDEEMAKRYEQWIVEYGRVYANQTEKTERFSIFKKNVEFINSFNRNQTFTLGINQFADLTDDEFQSRMACVMPGDPWPSGPTPFMYKNMTNLPSGVDWVTQGAVTPVKNQEHCGCCWAFSAVAAMEGIIQISSKRLISLSEQQLVDCNKANHGCHGGWMHFAFKYVVDNKGITTEANYPYNKKEGPCQQDKASKVGALISRYQLVPRNSEESLMKAVANQPVSVAIDAMGKPFRFYKKGVFTTGCTTTINHAVTAVGYGSSQDGKKFWLLKNSWGDKWGAKGYIKLQKDVGTPEGLCGITFQPSYPIV